LPALSWSASGLWRGRLTSKLESEFNRPNSGTSAIGKRSEAAVDPDKAIVVSSIAVSPEKLSVILCSYRECGAFPDVLPVFPAPRVDIAADVLDFGRIAICIVAAAPGRIVRHVNPGDAQFDGL
jgi:hypothetical protein